MAPHTSILLSVLCLCSVPAALGDPLQPDRPGQANPPTVLAPGVVQIEGGFTFQRETDEDPDTDTLTVPEIELRLGVHDRLELQASADGFVREWRDGGGNRSGGSDLGLAARALLWRQSAWRPATALGFSLSIPTGSGFATSDGVDPEFAVLYAWDIGQRWNLNGNFDFASESQGNDDSSHNFVFSPSLALGLTINDRVGAFIEYYGAIDDDAPDQHSVDGGFSFLANDDLQFDLSAGAGLNDAAPDFFLSAGVAWRLPRRR